MPKIPDVTAIPRAIPQGRAPIARVDTRYAGAGMGELSGALGDIAELKSRQQYAKAESDFLISKGEMDNEYEQDEDYLTMPDRYEEGASTKLSEIAAGISDPVMRDEFMTKNRVRVAQGVERVRGIAWNKEKDFERGDLKTRLHGLREGALKSGDLVAANQAAISLLDAAGEFGYLTEQERVDMTMTFKNDLAVGRLKMMEPEDRIDALKESWAKNIPSDVRAELKRDAEKVSRANKAIGIVDKYMSKDLDIAEGMAEAEKISDLRLRKEVESRFAYDYGNQQKATVEQRSELRDKYFSDVALGKLRVDEIPSDEWDAMGADVQSSLIAAQSGSARASKTPFNLIHHDRLMQLKLQADRGVPGAGVKLREYFIANAHDMSTKQQEDWSTASIEGVMPLEVESGLTDTQIISSRLPENTDANKRRELLGAMGEWRMKFIEQNNKQPTDKDRDAAIDRMLLEYPTGKFLGIRYGTMPAYEMTDQDAKEAMALMKLDNPELFADVVEAFKEKGVQPTAAQFMEAYSKLNGTQ